MGELFGSRKPAIAGPWAFSPMFVFHRRDGLRATIGRNLVRARARGRAFGCGSAALSPRTNIAAIHPR